MKEVLRTNNLIEISWAQSVLADMGIETVVLDNHTAMMEGSIGAIQQRVMVHMDDYNRAGRILKQAAAEIEG